jgi:phosphatidylglycerol:prolipoprotein diacylglycerol transferase
MNPEMFNIGGFSIRWYSFLILIGIIIAFVFAVLEEKRKKFPKDFVYDIGFWLILFGILGARLYYVLFNLDYYLSNPLEIIAVWNGGLAIHGGIIAGVITAFIYCKKKDINLLETCDLIVPSVIIAQAIGRWGNFFNSEAHGPITTLAKLKDMYIPDFVINGMFIDGQYYIPTFYYESLWCIFGFVIMIICRYKWKNMKVGQMTGLYLFWYGVGRFFIESLRTDSLMFFNLKIAQLVSIIFIILGIVFFVLPFLKNRNKNNVK